jgi:aminomethyltransferase
MESAATPHKSELRKTPLNTLHRRLGAKMVNFGGWDMPVEYPAGLIAEHKAVRASVGVFDVSHMGDIRIRSGAKPGGALAAVQHISMNDATKLAIGQAHYSAMLYPEGTFVDDVIVHRLGEDDFLLVINAGTREKDIDWVAAGRRCDEEAVGREPRRHQELLVHAWNGVRFEGHADCAHRVHGRGWF